MGIMFSILDYFSSFYVEHVCGGKREGYAVMDCIVWEGSCEGLIWGG